MKKLDKAILTFFMLFLASLIWLTFKTHFERQEEQKKLTKSLYTTLDDEPKF